MIGASIYQGNKPFLNGIKNKNSVYCQIDYTIFDRKRLFVKDQAKGQVWLSADPNTENFKKNLWDVRLVISYEVRYLRLFSGNCLRPTTLALSIILIYDAVGRRKYNGMKKNWP